MSKFCEGCGAEIDDAAVKCTECAEKEAQSKVAADTTSDKKAESAKVSKPINKGIIFGGIGLVAILAIIFIIIALFSNNYKSPINNMFKGMQKANLKTYLKAYPEFMGMDEYLDQEDMDDMLESLEEKYGKDIKISYKILDKEKIDKDDLKDVEEKIEKYYSEKLDGKDVKVKAGYKVTVKSTVTGKKDSESDTDTMKVYNINGKWYLLGM